MKIGVPQLDDDVPQSPKGMEYLVNAYAYPEQGVRYHCPCCRYPTLPTRGGFEICPVCYWEDDGQDSHDADRVRGGPNEAFSLTQARANYAITGTYDAKRQSSVRLPTDEEIRNRNNDC